MNALVTMAISEEYKEIGKLTFPLLEAYASRCGLAYYNIDSLAGHSHPVWERFARLYDLLLTYDRILVAEADVIVHPVARDVMAHFSCGTFYGFDEYPFDSEHCVKCWDYAMDIWPDEFPQSKDVPNHLYNTGLCLVDWRQRSLFKAVSREIEHGMMDMAVLNMRLHRDHIPHHDLRPETFNASHLWEPGQPRPDFLHIMWQAGTKLDGVKEFLPKMGYV